MSKYRNRKTGGFDSKREAKVYAQLEASRLVSDPDRRVDDIWRQVRYELIPSQKADGRVIERPVHYVADFRVTYASGRVEVIDVKGFRTKDYIIKRKLMLFRHGIRVREL